MEISSINTSVNRTLNLTQQPDYQTKQQKSKSPQ